jgi:hypothetical protein
MIVRPIRTRLPDTVLITLMLAGRPKLILRSPVMATAILLPAQAPIASQSTPMETIASLQERVATRYRSLAPAAAQLPSAREARTSPLPAAEASTSPAPSTAQSALEQFHSRAERRRNRWRDYLRRRKRHAEDRRHGDADERNRRMRLNRHDLPR